MVKVKLLLLAGGARNFVLTVFYCFYDVVHMPVKVCFNFIKNFVVSTLLLFWRLKRIIDNKSSFVCMNFLSRLKL
jgi:hypothetical protein